jgi:hypothetical protein
VLGEDPQGKAIRQLREEIRRSPRVATLLKNRDRNGRIKSRQNVYDKWQGAHWILATLADIGYPLGDKSLFAARDQILDFWLSDSFYREFDAEKKSDAYKLDGVPVMRGRHRRCAAQQGNALYMLCKLGLANERCKNLVERLLHWQWPDGGWNCDKNPAADTSSFMETLLPLRGLAIYAKQTGDRVAMKAARRAAEIFLTRKLFKRRSDGKIIHKEFVALHYPLYWHYDILGGLRAMVELDLIRDSRCNDALDLLEEKRLPDGSWPAESRYYKTSSKIILNGDYVDWGGTSKTKMNPWVTADALGVLGAAGRIRVH